MAGLLKESALKAFKAHSTGKPTPQSRSPHDGAQVFVQGTGELLARHAPDQPHLRTAAGGRRQGSKGDPASRGSGGGSLQHDLEPRAASQGQTCRERSATRPLRESHLERLGEGASLQRLHRRRLVRALALPGAGKGGGGGGGIRVQRHAVSLARMEGAWALRGVRVEHREADASCQDRGSIDVGSA